MTSPYQNTTSENNDNRMPPPYQRNDDDDDDEDDDDVEDDDGPMEPHDDDEDEDYFNSRKKDIPYGKTSLIESFHPGNDEDGSYAKMKSEPPPVQTTKTTTTTSTTKGTQPSTAKTTFKTTSITSTASTFPAAPPQPPTTVENKKQKNRNKGGGGKKNSTPVRQPTKESSSELDETADLTYLGMVGKAQMPTPLSTTSTRKNQRKSADEKLELDAYANVDFDYDEVSVKTKPTKMGNRDSNIHIVKPEKNGAVAGVAARPYDSKIIEIKPSGKKMVKRFTTDVVNELYGEEATIVIQPSALIGAIPPPQSLNITISPRQLPGLAGCLQRLLGVERPLDMSVWSRLPSLEFINFVVAIAVWSARYPAVFWGTSKSFAMVFSVQMIANGCEILLGYAGVSVLYKLQIVGQSMPLQAPPHLLNAVVTISLYLLSTVLILSSSLILYLYGHGRLSARIRDRRIISTKSGDNWAYFAHCSSLCFILALAVVKAPLLHDLSSTYRGSLDGAVLVAGE